jgi:hypothetical protein
MKKLNKLTINPSKVMKNEELVNLKGGYAIAIYKCQCTHGEGGIYYISLPCGDPGPISYTHNCSSGYQNCEMYGEINCYG